MIFPKDVQQINVEILRPEILTPLQVSFHVMEVHIYSDEQRHINDA